MNLIKKYRIVIAIVLPLSILVIIRTFGSGRFKFDADRWAQSSYDNGNLLTFHDMEMLAGDRLIINLGDNQVPNVKSVDLINISPDSLFQRKYYSMIKDHNGPVILMSGDPGMSARIWMLISQTGIKNLYILTPDSTIELFKFKFRPLTDGTR